jgi:hypothetical protein
LSGAPGRNLLLLGLRFVILFALLAGVWMWAGRYYARALAWVVDALVPWVESPRLTVSVREFSQVPEELQRIVADSDAATGPGSLLVQFGIQSGNLFPVRGDFHFNLAFLLALLWATLTNVRPKRRLAVAAACTLLLFAYHVVQVELYVKGAYASGWAGPDIAEALFTDGQRAFLDVATSLAKIGERGFPALLWLGIFLGTRPVSATTPSPGAAPSPVPESASSR